MSSSAPTSQPTSNSNVILNSVLINDIAHLLHIPTWGALALIIAVIVLAVIIILYAFIFYLRKRSKIAIIKSSSTSIYSDHGDDKETNPLIESFGATSKLREIFQYGKVLQLHTAKGPKAVTMNLVGYELRWESATTSGTKKYKLDLKEVLFVEWGKKTRNLTQCSADEKFCFSLISNIGTLDIEASSESERDKLARAFSDYITAVKKGGL